MTLAHLISPIKGQFYILTAYCSVVTRKFCITLQPEALHLKKLTKIQIMENIKIKMNSIINNNYNCISRLLKLRCYLIVR